VDEIVKVHVEVDRTRRRMCVRDNEPTKVDFVLMGRAQQESVWREKGRGNGEEEVVEKDKRKKRDGTFSVCPYFRQSRHPPKGAVALSSVF